MTDSFVGINEPLTIDKRADTEQLVVGANTVERERVQVAGAAATDIAGVTAANGLDVDVTRLSALVAGTANIGDVDVLTIAAGDNNIGNVDVVTLPALVAGTANIGDVDVLSIAAGETHLGEVGGNSIVKEVTLSLDTAIYATGEVLAATQEITTSMRVAAGTGVLHSLVVLDQDDQAGALDIVLLRTNVGIGTENAAVSVTDADADEILGVVKIAAGDYVDLVNSQIAVKTSLGIVVDAAAAATSLWVAAISRDAKTYTASGITLKLGFLRD